MGEIIDSRGLSEGEVCCKILFDQEEIQSLQGHMRNVVLFSSDLCSHDSCVNNRGSMGVTKYFKIPLSMRSRKRSSGVLNSQKIETSSNIFYIYSLEKKLEK